MIKLDPHIDPTFAETVQKMRQQYIKPELFDKQQSWVAAIRHDIYEMAENPDFLAYVVRELVEHERNMIYSAVVDSKEEWTRIRSNFLAIDKFDLMARGQIREFAVRVDANVIDNIVYIPLYEQRQMPPDVYKCEWCGGYTHNDKRGHCAGCGGPRQNYKWDR